MLLLASQSPRRAELLRQLNIPFVTHNVCIDETARPKERSDSYVVRLAIEKATAGLTYSQTLAPNHQHKLDFVLGADTIVVANQSILGKPKNFDHARMMWQQLAGKPHKVKTAVAIAFKDRTIHSLVITKVWFKALSEEQMLWYWQTGEPQDKAGGYGIQGLAGQYVKKIKGSYSAVVGLPLYETSELIKLSGCNVV